MSFEASVYKVMIASPSDVDSERGIIRQVIHEWNSIYSEDMRIVLMPVGWETHSAPSMRGRPQAVINRQILKDCDLLVAVFWTRLGTPTGESPSGTVEEIEEHLEAGKPAMIYFSSTPVRLDSVDEDQFQALKRFKEELRQKGLIATYESHSDFHDKFSRQLGITVLHEFAVESTEVPSTSVVSEYPGQRGASIANLSNEARRLLIAASEDSKGVILKVRSMSGLTVQTNGVNFVDSDNPRSEAIWTDAVETLLREGLIADVGHKGEVFQLTAEGYEVADHLSGRA